jgi:serine protease DegQ
MLETRKKRSCREAQESWRNKMEASENTSSSLQALSQNLAAAVEQAARVVVAVNARHRIPSSGVLWQEGTVVTADHTLKREEEITVMLPDNRIVSATVAGRDPGTDLAVLKLDGAGSDRVEIGDTSSLKVGNLVFAVGRVGERGACASLGIVSAAGGPWRTWRGGQVDQFVRPDVALYPGFSGGPLVDVRGIVLGINTSGLSRQGGLTLPVSTVNRVVSELLARGHIARPFIGVGMHPVRLPGTLKDRLGLPGPGGVIVLSVEPGGPADNAGLLIGDVLVALDDAPVNDTDDVQAALGSKRVGQNLPASVVRGGELIRLEIKVGERPPGSR